VGDNGPDLARDGVSIIVRGAFNPSIISPAWLVGEDLISREEFMDTSPQLITPDIAVINGSFFDLQVTREAMQLAGPDPSAFEAVRDLAVGILRTLRHTPVSVMGVNRSLHIPFDDMTAYYRLGDVLAPKTYWSADLAFAGLQNLTVQGARADRSRGGRVVVTVQPSNVVVPGVFLLHNDHYTLSGPPVLTSRDDLRVDPSENEATPEKTSVAVDILQQDWKASMDRAISVVQHIWQARNAT
jgi:hypothetical protein